MAPSLFDIVIVIMAKTIAAFALLIAVAAAVGPCVVSSDECTDLIDSSACYNSAIGSQNATALFECGQGGPAEVREVSSPLWDMDTNQHQDM